MRPRASREVFDCIYALSKWTALLVCLSSLTPNNVIALSENGTFKSAFGLDSAESIENYNAENDEPSLMREEVVAKMPLELEGFVTQKTVSAPVEKENNSGANPVQVPPEAEKALASDSFGLGVSPDVQISGKMADEKNEKYIRYGK